MLVRFHNDKAHAGIPSLCSRIHSFYLFARTLNSTIKRINAAVYHRLAELCDGKPEDQFDAWCRKRLYPALAVYDVMPFGVDKKMYERRLGELCDGEPENEFDAWLKERFYPIVACFTVPTSMISVRAEE